MAASGAVTPPTYRVTKALRTRNRNNSNSFARRNAQICTIQLRNRFSASALPPSLPPPLRIRISTVCFSGEKWPVRIPFLPSLPSPLSSCVVLPVINIRRNFRNCPDLSADWSDYASVSLLFFFFFFFFPHLYTFPTLSFISKRDLDSCAGGYFQGGKIALHTMGKYNGIISVSEQVFDCWFFFWVI